MAEKFKIGDKVKVKKGLNQEEILKQYFDGPLTEEEQKEILKFYEDTETVHILKDACDGNFSTDNFGYVIVDNFFELVEESKVTKEGLINVFGALFKNFSESNKKEAMENELFNFLNSKKEWLKSPDSFDSMVMGKFENIIDTLVEQEYQYADDTIKGIYFNYGIYESIVRRIIKSQEGHACCADKSRFILRSYFQYAKEGKLPEYNTENYWVPNKGSNDSWIGLLRGISSLINSGNPTDYLIRMREIIES